MSKIQLSFEPLSLRTAHPFGISYGTSTRNENVLVRLRFEEWEGLGEAAPASYHNETPSTVKAVLTEIEESGLLGDDPFAIVNISRSMDRKVAGNSSAKAAIEMALHDLAGKLLNTPVYQLLGLSGLMPPMTDFTIGIDSLEVIEKKTLEAVQAGYKILKVKQGTDYDEAIIKRIRKIAPDLPLRVDANGGWSPKQAIRMSHFLADYQVEFIEQPLPKYASVEDFKLVKTESPLPIFADESICLSSDVARMAHAIDGVVVKLAKTGGLLEAVRVIHTARAHGLAVMFGMMIESSLGVTAACHLASLTDHLDLDGALLLSHDPFLGAVYENGYLKLPQQPGLGVVKRH